MILALLLSLPSLAGDPAADAPLVLRMYDLTGVLPRATGTFGAERLFPHVRVDDQEQLPETPEHEAPEPETLLQLIHEQSGGEFDLEGRWLQLTNDRRLLVRAPEATQKSVLELLQASEGLFGATSELLIDVVQAPAAPPNSTACVVGASDAEKWLAGAGGTRSSYRLEFRPGENVGIDLTGTRTFIGDYNVEIAQAATIFDPIVAVTKPGTRLQASCSPAPGGAWLALTLRTTTPIGALRENPLELHGQITAQHEMTRSSSPRSIQSQPVENGSIGLNAFVAEGKALVLRTALDVADRSSRTWIVVRVAGRPFAREVRLTAANKHGAGEFRAYPLGFARPTAVHSDGLGLYGSRRDGMGERFPVSLFSSEGSQVSVQFERSSYDELFDSMRSEQNDLALSTWGAWMLASKMDMGEPQKPADFEAITAALARLGPSPRMFQIGLTLRRGGANGATLASAAVVARAGEPAFVVLGREETRVYDYDVEVAQSCSVADPQVEIAFEGLALQARPVVGLSGDARLELHARGRVQRGTTHEYESGSSTLGGMTQSDCDELLLAERLTFAKDGPRVVRLGDTSGGSGGLVLEVELTEVR